MTLLAETWQWFTDAANWSGANGIPHRVLQHIGLSAFAVACAIAIAIPIAVVLGHRRTGGVAIGAVVNIGRAIPSFAILAVAFPIALRWGIDYGFWPTWAAVLLLALPPMFTNTHTAIVETDASSVDAARGMGMRERDVLFGVEVPLALPLILAAVRVSAVQVVATVPLGAVLGWGGLGRYLLDGRAQYDFAQVLGGTLLVAVLAILTELFFTGLEKIVLPHGVRRLTRSEATAAIVSGV